LLSDWQGCGRRISDRVLFRTAALQDTLVHDGCKAKFSIELSITCTSALVANTCIMHTHTFKMRICMHVHARYMYDP
jgi:hypothetical protein